MLTLSMRQTWRRLPQTALNYRRSDAGDAQREHRSGRLRLACLENRAAVATSQLAQTTLRSVVGRVQLDDLLGDRARINAELQEILDQQAEPWGVKVSAVEVKNVDLPEEMQRAIARQAGSGAREAREDHSC